MLPFNFGHYQIEILSLYVNISQLQNTRLLPHEQMREFKLKTQKSDEFLL